MSDLKATNSEKVYVKLKWEHCSTNSNFVNTGPVKKFKVIWNQNDEISLLKWNIQDFAHGQIYV